MKDDSGEKVVYRVYYPGKGTQLKHEDFEADSEEDAKGAAEDFAMNFPRYKVIIHKLNG